jgi:hypothetical protein
MIPTATEVRGPDGARTLQRLLGRWNEKAAALAFRAAACGGRCLAPSRTPPVAAVSQARRRPEQLHRRRHLRARPRSRRAAGADRIATAGCAARGDVARNQASTHPHRNGPRQRAPRRRQHQGADQDPAREPRVPTRSDGGAGFRCGDYGMPDRTGRHRERCPHPALDSTARRRGGRGSSAGNSRRR